MVGALGALVGFGLGAAGLLGAGASLRSTSGATLDAASVEAGAGEVGEVTPALGVLACWTGVEAGAVILEVRVVVSLEGLFWAVAKVSVMVSELVATEGIMSSTVAVVSAGCLWRIGVEERKTI